MATLACPDILLIWASSVSPTTHSAQHRWPSPQGEWTGSRGTEGACLGWGHTGCPVNQPSPEQCPVAPSACSRSRSGCMSQEKSQIPRPPVGPPGFTAAAGPWPPGIVPGWQCPVHGVHRSLQGGPLSPCPHSSSGPSRGLSLDLTASLPFPAISVGWFYPALVWTRLPAGVVCFQEMWPWCAPGGGGGVGEWGWSQHQLIYLKLLPRTVCDTHYALSVAPVTVLEESMPISFLPFVNQTS